MGDDKPSTFEVTHLQSHMSLTAPGGFARGNITGEWWAFRIGFWFMGFTVSPMLHHGWAWLVLHQLDNIRTQTRTQHMG